jgi:hypothetical protein
LQLIEIVQLALLLFIAVSAIIFMFSYLGYRSKSKLDNKLPKEIMNDKNVDTINPKVVENSISQPKSDKPKNLIKKNPRFEVFTPDRDGKFDSEKSSNKKSHIPKTLTIKNKSDLK